MPRKDVFHAVGRNGQGNELIADMIKIGFTGEKGLGGFYRINEDEKEFAVDLKTGMPRPRIKTLPLKAQLAAENQLLNRETLHDLIVNTDGSDAGAKQTQFCRNVLARVLAYAASLIPSVTTSPQDIDDAMKLGFNWVRGPFELIDVIGPHRLVEMITDAGEAVPNVLSGDTIEPFYVPTPDALQVRRFPDDHPEGLLGPVALADKVVRFNMTRRCLTPIQSNAAASLYALDDDLRLIEFHSKANALTGASMEIVNAAAKDHGKGIIIHNDAQHFSAGVDLNGVLALIREENWEGIDQFLINFQQAVKALKYTPVPVVGAPSGLAIGGGFEVIAHADKVIAHGNSVLGLVEAAVGVVPGGGGVKETFYRWHQNTGDWSKAAWNTWMQMGFARTGTSPEQSAKLMYFLPDRDETVMNRDRLVSAAIESVHQQNEAGYTPPASPAFILPNKTILGDMEAFMDNGISDGHFFPHDKTVAMHIANIVVNHDGEGERAASEDELYARERDAFIKLAKTEETKQRISGLLEDGLTIRN
ncbi:MAG: 3-hydroxyacyl-CoA dehydrogenase [Gammaproteobacteria bacterium]